MWRNAPLLLLLLLGCTAPAGVRVFGFGDFCFDGACWVNPSAPMAEGLGGQAVDVTAEAVAQLQIGGASVGLGVDPTTERAYICNKALGLTSTAGQGKDAGDYLCGMLLHRQLQVSRCSLFVHLPLNPTREDEYVVLRAIQLVRDCR